ncbi:MAG: hemerythrin domain-containing protein [Candidatus Parcubacteria bacterium]|nr:hemerythrin domain-containing protein [Burkholderiales bacterium]
MKESIRTMQDEHRSISSVLHALKHLARNAQDVTIKADFKVFRTMIRYIDEFPEQLHHPKEDKFLFARLAEACPGARPLIARLESEHKEGARLVRELERALILFDNTGPDGVANFCDMVDLYTEFQWDHMRLEDNELLPLAELHFTPEDWRVVDEGFSSNTDPIAQIKEKDFQALFSRLVVLAPAPVGLGEPWKKLAEVD